MLHYLGVVIFKKLLPSGFFNHFLLLNVAVKLLSHEHCVGVSMITHLRIHCLLVLSMNLWLFFLWFCGYYFDLL